ncbi:MAG: response regulator [Candidatus Magnetomorum sp.]|nr:response regulator [Candidatus Magnetomorum sp.]
MKHSILIVDDEQDIRDVLNISLSDLGYHVLTAESGEKALEIIDQFNPAIVLTDIKMPGMSGIDLLKAIKRRASDTEVIMITGHGDMELAIQSLKLNATDFITKPINDDILDISLKKVEEKIAMRRQIQQYTQNLEKLVEDQAARLIEIERIQVVDQLVHGMTSTIKHIANQDNQGITFLNDFPWFVSIHSPNLKILAVNQPYKEKLGNTIGKNSGDIYKNIEKSSESPIAQTFLKGQSVQGKYLIHDKNGHSMPIMVYTLPVRNSSNTITLALEISVNVIERERLAQELKHSQKKYQKLFDDVPCYIAVLNRSFQITNANKRFIKDFGYQEGDHCYRVFKHRQAQCTECPVANTFKDGKSYHTETVVTANDNKQYHVLIRTAPIRNTDGDIIEVMEMATDITQIRELQDHLSSLGLLIGSVSHSIKGLLTGLDGGMYLISSGIERQTFDRVKEGWTIVQLLVGRIQKMVQDILFYAKERELKWESVDVIEFANELATMMRTEASKHGISLSCKFHESIGTFTIDRGVVHSALVNIFENAIDACLADKNKPDHHIRFNVLIEKDTIVFDIQDNGIGMDQETKEKIFTLFFSSKGHRGTGLGMFISNKIIQQHGGTIQVTSEPNHGTRFIINIPIIIKHIPE